MITKEQLQAMSDFEVNKALAELQPHTTVIGDGKYLGQSESAVHVEQRKFKYANVEEFGIDYCNTPNDIMPLAEEVGLDIQLGGASAIAATDLCAYYEFGDCDHVFVDDNYLRAIACCLILVLQEKAK